MKNRVIGILAAITLAASSAHAGAVSCSFSDLSGIQSGGIACAGFYNGNILNSKNYSTIAGILTNLTGTAWSASEVAQSFSSKIELGGSHNVDFAGLLTGPTVVAIHKGAGNGSDGARINGTSFYYFDAGTSLDAFRYNLNGSSNAVAFSVPLSNTAPVPEPSTYALFGIGLAVTAYVATRRKPS